MCAVQGLCLMVWDVPGSLSGSVCLEVREPCPYETLFCSVLFCMLRSVVLRSVLVCPARCSCGVYISCLVLSRSGSWCGGVLAVALALMITCLWFSTLCLKQPLR